MVTKTLTITEDAYNLLIGKKRSDESFSEEIKRLLSGERKKSLMDYFGIISYEEGEAMLSDLKRIKEANKKLIRL